MSEMTSRGRVKSITWEAVVTRADGTVEDLGTIAHYHRNPLKRWAWAIRQGVRKTWRH